MSAPARHATFSGCRRYRYSLEQSWGEGGKVLFIMLNPSTADERLDDPTVRRCWGFAATWGYGRAEVCNLFAFRATDPREMLAEPHPVGPNNDSHLIHAAAEADLIVCAWGVHGAHLGRAEHVTAMLRFDRRVLHALGFTQGGQPRHPLYLRADTKPVRLEPSTTRGARCSPLQATSNTVNEPTPKARLALVRAPGAA